MSGMRLNTLCKKLMNILNHQIFAKIKARRSLIALAIKASTQRKDWQKDGFKMFINLLHSVLSTDQLK